MQAREQKQKNTDMDYKSFERRMLAEEKAQY